MNLDEQLFLVINRALDTPIWSILFSVVTGLGNGLVLTALVVPAMFFFDRRRLRSDLIPLALCVALGGLAVSGAKVAVGRQRPPQHFAHSGIEVNAPLGEPGDMSFPSGHTQTAFGTATYLCALYPAGAPVFIILAALVGLSRVALGVHFPLDVVAGAMVGMGISLLGFRLNRARLHAGKGAANGS